MTPLVNALHDQVARSALPTGSIVADVATEDVATYTVNALMLRVLTRPAESAATTTRLALALLLLLPALTSADASADRGTGPASACRGRRRMRGASAPTASAPLSLSCLLKPSC
jgi:hypothetical protein